MNKSIRTPGETGDKKIRRGLKGVLKLSGFRRLWIGQIFSQLADKFYIVLMVYLIAQYWVESASTNHEVLEGVAAAVRIDFKTRAEQITLLATGIYIANTIPAIILGTVAGVAADRWPKRRIMVASNGLRAILLILTPLCLLPGPSWLGVSWGYWAAIVMTFLESTLTQFFAPAEQASIPLLVPNEQLLAANSLYQATSMGATIVGFALGEPLLTLMREAFLGIGVNGGEFLLLPFFYAMAAISISTIFMKESRQRMRFQGVWQEIIDGFQVLKERPKVRRAMFNLVILYSLLAALYVLAISLASLINGLGPTQFGILLASTGIGIAFGAIFIGQIGDSFKRKRLTSAGLSSITISLMLLAGSIGSLLWTITFCGLLGIGSALVAIPAQTTLQEDTPAAKRGKVFGLQNNLINISLSLPLVLASTLLNSFGLIPVLWVLASLALIAAIFESTFIRC